MAGLRLSLPMGCRPGLLALALLATTAFAEQGVLVVHVADPAERPLAGILIGVKGAGSLARTGSDGKARIVLAPETTAGSPITLMLGPQDAVSGEAWVFRSPDGGRTVVPSFENDSENFVSVVLETLAAKNEVTAIVETLVASHRLRETELQEQIRALTSAVETLAAQQGRPAAPPGIDQALAALREGDTTAAEGIFSQILERKTSESTEARQEAAAAARHLGALAFLDDTEKSLAAYQQAVELDPEYPGGWSQLGRLLQRIGRLDEAETAYREVLGLSITQRDTLALAIATGRLGTLHLWRGQLQRAGSDFSSALGLYASIDHSSGMAREFANLGVVYLMVGDLESADTTLGAALDFFEGSGDWVGIAETYNSLGGLERARGRPAEAESLHRKALDIDKVLGNKEGMANGYAGLGLVFAAREDWASAELLLKRALDLDRDLGNKEGMAKRYASLGIILSRRDDLEQAEAARALARKLFGELGMAWRARGNAHSAEPRVQPPP